MKFDNDDGSLLALGALTLLAGAGAVATRMGGSAARSTPIAVGDGVQYKAAFLRSIGEITGPLPFAKGTVTKVDTYGSSFAIATIDWGDDEIPPRVNVGNLKRISDWEPN